MWMKEEEISLVSSPLQIRVGTAIRRIAESGVPSVDDIYSNEATREIPIVK